MTNFVILFVLTILNGICLSQGSAEEARLNLSSLFSADMIDSLDIDKNFPLGGLPTTAPSSPSPTTERPTEPLIDTPRPATAPAVIGSTGEEISGYPNGTLNAILVVIIILTMIMAGQLAATLVAFRAFNVPQHQRGAPAQDPKLPSKPGDCATEERSTATVDISDAV